MGEPLRLVCPSCRSENVYDIDKEPELHMGDVRRHGGSARCKACGAFISVRPPYVTEVGDEHGPSGAHGLKHDRTEGYARARARLREHVTKYPDYLDRDRDLLLLQLAEHVDELHNKLNRIIDALAPGT